MTMNTMDYTVVVLVMALCVWVGYMLGALGVPTNIKPTNAKREPKPGEIWVMIRGDAREPVAQ